MTDLIVDGYNVLHAADRYRRLLASDVAVARDRLVNDLTGLAGSGGSVTVVFDGAGNPDADRVPQDVAGVTVVFSPAGIEADTLVEAMAKDAARSVSDVLVVTSDSETANAVSGGAIRVVSAAGFAAELDEQRTELVSDRGHNRAVRSTVEDRLSPEVHATLLRMRRRRP